ncbi:MAG: hypothetical protein D6791_07295 [Chloroflexi bacterium]|nr:MAG: hypothetical protein D6791_07295 [Chloroflexota bacterium]
MTHRWSTLPSWIVMLSALALLSPGLTNLQAEFPRFPTIEPMFAAPLASRSDNLPGGTWSRWAEQPTLVDLRDVYLYSQDQVWAVGGEDRDAADGDIPIILHYLDRHWSVEQGLPEETQHDVRFNAVDGAGPDNLWVAGQAHRPTLSPNDVGILVHYDGAAWQEVPLPESARIAPLTDIDVVPTEAGFELWAISEANAQCTSYILHFDGAAWDIETIQNRSLLGIHMLNAEEGQIVTKGACGAPDGHHYWYHDGFWQATSVWTPQPLHAVFMVEPTYGWAVGDRGATDEYEGQCHTPGIQCRWNARQAMRTRLGAAITPNLRDVKMLSREEGWVVGEPWDGLSTVAYLTQEGNPRWEVVPVADDPGKALYGLAMLAGPDGHALEGWAVGVDGTILHYTAPQPEPSPTPTTSPTSTETAQPTSTATVTPRPSAPPSVTVTPTPTSSLPRRQVFMPMVLHQSRSEGRLD